MEISAQQLAELLLGVARAQAAMIQGLENEMARVRSGRIIPALQDVAHLRDHPQPTLTDLPVPVLLATLGRQTPDAAGAPQPAQSAGRRRSIRAARVRVTPASLRRTHDPPPPRQRPLWTTGWVEDNQLDD